MSQMTVVVGVAGCVMPPPRDAPPRPRHPPAYTVAAQMARLQRLGRAHSHEGVTGGYYHTDPEEDGELAPHMQTRCLNPFHILMH